MYAIVDIAGQQFKVEKNKKIFVHRLEEAEGKDVEFDKILLLDDNGKVQVGAPLVKDMLVKAKVLEHLKGDKVQVFKKKRRKGYQKLNGHRQYLTAIEILDIVAGKKTAATASKAEAKPAAKKTEAPKAEAAPTEAVKKETSATTETKKAVEKKATETKKASTTKTTAKKETSEKKPAAKKVAAKKPATTKKAPSSSAKKEDKE